MEKGMRVLVNREEGKKGGNKGKGDVRRKGK
jgi:hypothetical protein